MAPREESEEKGSRVISFRLEAGYARRLEELAFSTKTTPGSAARRIVLAALEEEPLEHQVSQAFERLERILFETQGQLSSLQESQRSATVRFNDAVQALLVNAGKMRPEEAQAYARRRLLNPEAGKT